MHGKPAVQISAFPQGASDRQDHRVINTIKQKIAREVLARFSVQEIKMRSIGNIERWRAKGTFVKRMRIGSRSFSIKMIRNALQWLGTATESINCACRFLLPDS